MKTQHTGVACDIKPRYVAVVASSAQQAGHKQETELEMHRTGTVVTCTKRCYGIVWCMCMQSSHTIGYVAVACDPATVSCAPVHIICLGIKDILGGQGRPHHVSPRGVLHPLGLAC